MNIHWRPTTCHCSEICLHSCTHTYTHTQSHLSSCGSCLLQAPHFPLNLISHQGSPVWMFSLGKVPSAPTHICKVLLKHFDSVVQFNKYQLNCYQVQWHRHVEDWVPCLKEPSVSSVKPVQFSSVAQSCPILCDPMNRSTPGLPVRYQLPEFTQTHVHWVGNAIQPSHLLLSPSPPAPNRFQHQGLFQWVNSSHQVAKVLEFQLQHQSFQWTPRTHLLYDGLVGSPWSPRDSQESSPTSQFKSINSSALSFLHSPTLTSIHDHGKTIALTRQTSVGKVMSLLYNMLSRLVITFLPSKLPSKRLLISLL